jgi:DNA-binding NarL/FixJ family response regulator
MTCVAQALPNKEIAWQLGIAEGSVKTYLTKLYKKLGVTDRMELALMARKYGRRARQHCRYGH